MSIWRKWGAGVGNVNAGRTRQTQRTQQDEAQAADPAPPAPRPEPTPPIVRRGRDEGVNVRDQ
jgi:hypothetical protein